MNDDIGICTQILWSKNFSPLFALYTMNLMFLRFPLLATIIYIWPKKSYYYLQMHMMVLSIYFLFVPFSLHLSLSFLYLLIYRWTYSSWSFGPQSFGSSLSIQLISFFYVHFTNFGWLISYKNLYNHFCSFGQWCQPNMGSNLHPQLRNNLDL